MLLEQASLGKLLNGFKSHNSFKQISVEISQPDENGRGTVTSTKSNGLNTYIACSGVDQRAFLLQENDNELSVDKVS